MNPIHIATAPISVPLQEGIQIPILMRQEAMTMSAEELKRFQALIESLDDEDWEQPTACTLWTVKDIVAHQAGHVIGFTSFRRFMSQMNPASLRPYRKQGMNMLDAFNQYQVDLRQSYSPADLIAEIRDNATASLNGRNRVPAFLRAITLPMPGTDQPRSPGYLFDVIYTRDMWMHRIDIHRAIKRNMTMDAAHDKRMVALIIRDLAQKARHGLGGRSAILELRGIAGGMYRIGANTEPTTTLEMDIETFCNLTSGREKASDILANGEVSLHGDTALGEQVVRYCENRVLY